MHTTASSLVAIAQYFYLFFLYGNQQKFNIEAVNDYPPIRLEIRFERKFPIRKSLLRSLIGDSCSRCERVDNSTSSWVELCRYKHPLMLAVVCKSLFTIKIVDGKNKEKKKKNNKLD